MKFYNSVGPNPRMVRMFMAEKGFDVPKVEVDLRGGENRRAPYNVEVNPAGQTPALELDDGSVLTEITAICEYLEEVGKGPALIGATPEERAALKTRLLAHAVHLESGNDAAKVAGPLREELRLMADWLGLEGLALPRDGALGREWSRMGK